MELELWQWGLALAGAFFVGLSKGGVPGIGNLTVVLYVYAFPAKQSVGILLPVLIAGDIVAVLVYRRHASWSYIRKLMPWTVFGVLIGYFTMDSIDDVGIRRLIGTVLVSMALIYFFRRYRMNKMGKGQDDVPHTRWFVGGMGMIAGFATMVANAAGPVASLFFLAAGLPKMVFIGTSAWFFLIINTFKVPFQVEIGIIDFSTIGLSLRFAIAAVLGALIAPRIVKYINQKLFEGLVWVFIVVAGLRMLF